MPEAPSQKKNAPSQRILRPRGYARRFYIYSREKRWEEISAPPAHARPRRYIYLPGLSRGKRLALRAAMLLCAAAALICLWELGAYGWDYFTAQQTSEELREAYYNDGPSPEPTDAPPSAEPDPDPSATPDPEVSPSPTPPPASRLSAVPYPHNPFNVIQSRFKPLQEYNPDVVGWLRIDALLDEAVVQRDNTYYLTHDSMGDENSNGAIFLEESCSLATRPYTLLLYGHNMKTGLQFGALRNYEHLSFYRANPFLSFDTIYEEGRYVIFSVATVSMLPDHWRYVDFAKLNSSTVSWRQEAIHSLQALSLYGSSLSVNADDQILVLVTCVDNDDDRRIIAARRIRENESEEQLRSVVRGAYAR